MRDTTAGVSCWESFVPGGSIGAACWESFVPVRPAGVSCGESFVPEVVLCAVQSSPCSASWWWRRYKVLPARAKQAEMGLFVRVGRVLYRLGCWCGCAGRVLYRLGCWCGRVGRVLYRVWLGVRYKVLPAGGRGGGSGIKFSLLGQNAWKWAFWGMRGEFCTGWAAGVGVLGEFCTG